MDRLESVGVGPLRNCFPGQDPNKESGIKMIEEQLIGSSKIEECRVPNKESLKGNYTQQDNRPLCTNIFG